MTCIKDGDVEINLTVALEYDEDGNLIDVMIPVIRKATVFADGEEIDISEEIKNMVNMATIEKVGGVFEEES